MFKKLSGLFNAVPEIKCDEQKYYLVPTTLILEGVHRSHLYGFVYYPGEELEKSCWAWEGKPILIDHPYKGYTANDKEVYEKQYLGVVLNAHWDSEINGIKCWAMIDKEQANKKWPRLIEHIENHKPFEFFVGVLSQIELRSGEFNGRKYEGRVVDIRPDHLAILPFPNPYMFDTDVLYRAFSDGYYVEEARMILEGVHIGREGAVLYSGEELKRSGLYWNGKPILANHPFKGDTADDKEVQDKQRIGTIYNTRWNFTDNALICTMVLDKKAVKEKCPIILEKLEQRVKQEVSTGLFSELVLESGVWKGEGYRGKITNIKPDHLAVLVSSPLAVIEGSSK